MNKVGFYGGNVVSELGFVNDMQLFFDCIRVYAVPEIESEDWPLITERLYKKYLHQDQLEQVTALMKEIKKVFTLLPKKIRNWQQLEEEELETCLDMQGEMLADVFKSYFEQFDFCVEAAQMHEEHFSSYLPVKIVTTTMPEGLLFRSLTLADFDELEEDDEPFWM